MDTRKLQHTGGSSYTVSLPQEWSEEHGMEGGSVVGLSRLGESVVITPERHDEATPERVSIADLEDGHVSRALVTLYVSGHDEVVLEGEEIDTERRASIRQVVTRLTGLQVVDEGPDTVRVRSLLDHGEMSTPEVVDRMHAVAGLMLEDAVTAALDDDAAAAGVLEREEDVNRMYAMVLRWFRQCMRDPAANERSPLALDTHFDFHACAKQLERIADHAATIADLAGDTGSIPTTTARSIADLRADARDVIDRAMEAFLCEDPTEATELANAVMDDTAAVNERAGRINSRLQDAATDRNETVTLVVDSVSSTAEYGGSIAESALQKATESPRPRRVYAE